MELCRLYCFTVKQTISFTSVTDPGENLTGALYSNFGHGGCGGCG